MNFAEHQRTDRRLVILRCLEGAVQYRAPSPLIGRFLDQFGHTVSTDVLTADLAWLREQGLAEAVETGGITVATLTARGLDVAQGRATVPGVARPVPGL